MFIGHYALAFAARPAVKKPGLGSLILAVSWVDLIWPVFLLLGLEEVRIAPGITARTPFDFVSYPWTHSLLMGFVWGILLAVVLGRNWSRRDQAIFALLVVSHWVLDWISHRPDMPLWPGGGPKLGLGLWYSTAATTVVESSMFVTGVALYLRGTTARDWKGHLSLWSFLLFIGALYVLDSLGGPPPPNVRVLAWVSLGAWLAPLWAMAIERTRRSVEASSA